MLIAAIDNLACKYVHITDLFTDFRDLDRKIDITHK